MNNDYLDVIADAGAAAITHIGLVDDSGDELSGGGYERQSVSWTSASDGLVRPDANLTFSVPAGQVGGWRGFDGSGGGATNYGGADLEVEEFTNPGTFTLAAAQTGILHG